MGLASLSEIIKRIDFNKVGQLAWFIVAETIAQLPGKTIIFLVIWFIKILYIEKYKTGNRSNRN